MRYHLPGMSPIFDRQTGISSEGEGEPRRVNPIMRLVLILVASLSAWIDPAHATAEEPLPRPSSDESRSAGTPTEPQSKTPKAGTPRWHYGGGSSISPMGSIPMFPATTSGEVGEPRRLQVMAHGESKVQSRPNTNRCCDGASPGTPGLISPPLKNPPPTPVDSS
jgi:hypothetical protein